MGLEGPLPRMLHTVTIGIHDNKRVTRARRRDIGSTSLCQNITGLKLLRGSLTCDDTPRCCKRQFERPHQTLAHVQVHLGARLPKSALEYMHCPVVEDGRECCGMDPSLTFGRSQPARGLINQNDLQEHESFSRGCARK